MMNSTLSSTFIGHTLGFNAPELHHYCFLSVKPLNSLASKAPMYKNTLPDLRFSSTAFNGDLLHQFRLWRLG